MAKRIFEVRVERHFDVDYVDLEVAAANQDQAEDLAVAEAKRNEDKYFGSRVGHTPSFEVAEIYDSEDEE